MLLPMCTLKKKKKRVGEFVLSPTLRYFLKTFTSTDLYFYEFLNYSIEDIQKHSALFADMWKGLISNWLYSRVSVPLHLKRIV